MKVAPLKKGNGNNARTDRLPAWLPRALWAIAIVMSLTMLALLIIRSPVVQAAASRARAEQAAEVQPTAPATMGASLPDYHYGESTAALIRVPDAHTTIPNRSSSTASDYEIKKGDSIFGIANQFKIKPESVLWANYNLLNDDVHMISIGLKLKIPPTDGIYYQWKEGDTLEKVAQTYKASVKDIVEWPGNRLDILDPEIEPGQYIMIPGGSREMQQWVVAVPYRDRSGVTKGVAGPGACAVPAGGNVGTGYFVWPAMQHFLSGNDYWSGHLAIDIAAGEGAPIYASDSGVVVYAGAIGGGYGNMIMIDHNNGYHTLYAHLAQINVFCGQNVTQGQYIGLAGSTGNSTGAHLHFEIRYLGGFINPWHVLP